MFRPTYTATDSKTGSLGHVNHIFPYFMW